MASPDYPPGRAIGAFFSFLGISCVVGVLLAGVGIPAAGFAASGAQKGADIFNSLPAELTEQPLAQQTTLLASDGSVLTKFYWENRIEVPLKKISKPMQDATVATEDFRFFQHGGVDLEGIGRAAVHDLISPDLQGASTLTQQYVKNVEVEKAAANGDPDKTAERVARATDSSGASGMARKLRQAKMAITLEKKYSKTEILNRYLNINNYSGSPRQYGVEAAARHFWGIHASELDIPQAALLAGVVKQPSGFNPQTHPKSALQRRNTVLRLMHKHDYISDNEYKKAKKTGLNLDIHKSPNGCTDAGISGYFCNYISHTIAHSKKLGKTKQARLNKLKRGGLTIKTTIDPKLQHSAKKIVSKRVPKNDPSGAAQSLITVEPGTGKVLAMVQDRKYSVSSEAKQSETSINFNVGRKLGGGNGFQTGSAYKIFTLAAWLADGHTLHDTVNASVRTFPRSSWTYKGCNVKDAWKYADNWTVHNSVSGEASSSMSALKATVQSVNTAYAAMANKINMCDIQGMAKKLGIRYGNGHSLDWVAKNNMNESLSPTMVLGTVHTTPMDMAAAYAAIANKGKYCAPIGITSIKNADGKNLPVPKANCHQAVPKGIAKGVAWTLTQTFDGGTTDGLDIGVPAGAKTGTTDFDVGAGWLVGFTKGMSTAVWTGNPNGQDPKLGHGKELVGGKDYGPNYGNAISGPSWQDFMKANASKHAVGDFDKPDSSILGHSSSSSDSSDSDEDSDSSDSSDSKSSDSESSDSDDSSDSSKSHSGDSDSDDNSSSDSNDDSSKEMGGESD